MTVNKDLAETLALQALGFILQEDALRERLLALSGLTGTELRERIHDDGFLLNILDFLVSHEPDLLACSEALNEPPEILVSAWRALGGQIME